MGLSLKKETRATYQDELQQLLDAFEKAEAGRIALVTKHAALFTKLDEFEEDKETLRQRMKRLVYHQKKKPRFLKSKLFRKAAHGKLLQVDVQYKHSSDRYDPKLLPNKVLTMPGIVSSVDTIAVDSVLASTRSELLKKGIKKAVVKGEWMTPAISVNRLTRDDKDQ